MGGTKRRGGKAMEKKRNNPQKEKQKLEKPEGVESKISRNYGKKNERKDINETEEISRGKVNEEKKFKTKKCSGKIRINQRQK